MACMGRYCHEKAKGIEFSELINLREHTIYFVPDLRCVFKKRMQPSPHSLEDNLPIIEFINEYGKE